MEPIPFKNPLEVRKRLAENPIMKQTWSNLLFLHWKKDPQEIQKTLPPGLFVDTFKGSGFMTITPFSIDRLTLANFPVPFFSSFLEVNLRTYVYDENGIPGIWFYSLDINSQIACQAARLSFSLPYFFCEINQLIENGIIKIKGKRTKPSEVNVEFEYRSIGNKSQNAEEHSLDFFLIERYLFFTFFENHLSIGKVHHTPYPLNEVELLKQKNTFQLNGKFNLQNDPDLIHFSPNLNVDFFSLKRDLNYKDNNGNK